ncbi:hypothetical protein BOTBODRAFT_68237 [Botryobasidium botryosum FD-172 SS1]|uniref:Uncharacterized protein n=1 Tax=Botryobasidium botryosum (strain FD-172 SS1) TaxID=930990 RepID=A0A067MHT4_BOTB1|nr:hypothetical protein BOTBODRAFT_68237 [Botryobasidium botryosum FD-172 SS1]
MTAAKKVAVVTGSSRGLGAAIIRRLAQDGFHVVINYKSTRAAGEALAEDINSQYGEGRAIVVQADLTCFDDVKKLAEASIAFGAVTCLCLNAAHSPLTCLDTVTPQVYDDVFNANVKGHVFLIQALASHMPPQSSIVTISSSVTRQSTTPANLLFYTASKGALEQITRTLAKELGPKQIRINTISPGPILGEHYWQVVTTPEKKALWENFSPMKRVGEEAEVAAVVSFFAGPDSRWVSGQEIRVDGGAVV